jgi:hypothetical protein
MMGMIGLALATALDYFFKTPGSYVPVWSPVRLLGTIAGAFLVYGVIHIACAMELILLLPFTKLAHIVYRPLAIWFTEFRRLRASTG